MMLSTSMVLVIPVTILYLVLIGPTTLLEAEDSLQEKSYTEITFNGLREKEPFLPVLEGTRPDRENLLAMYRFLAVKDKVKYSVTISPATGRIVGERKE